MVPWGITSFQVVNLFELIDNLNETHHGLDEVKEHILEYMTIEQISGSSKGTTLCFAGPPGTGKTSIAKQIAKATNRKIIKIAFGGMTDEAEIRGHRRTYVATKPGRVVAGLSQAQTMDPLFLLDEIDKIGGHRGDPVSALLELLDPEQNSEFVDRYLEVGIDLSKAMFVCTANYLEQIPPPLKDRLEIIKFRDYTYDERLIIANNFLLPKAFEEYKLTDFDIKFDTGTIESLCRTNAIRDLERKIKKLLRKAAVSIQIHKKQSFLITKEIISETFKKMGDKKMLGFH
jgi:endopeptidase La